MSKIIISLKELLFKRKLKQDLRSNYCEYKCKKTQNQNGGFAIKLFVIFLLLLGGLTKTQANPHSMYHEMQHGFILSANDTFGSHLVATGHHSRQTEIIGQLQISDSAEREIYKKQKSLNSNNSSYFLFQAQSLDLPTLKVGQILKGHIVESQIGKYEPKNIIVKDAIFVVKKILLNIENPFFGDQ